MTIDYLYNQEKKIEFYLISIYQRIERDKLANFIAR